MSADEIDRNEDDADGFRTHTITQRGRQVCFDKVMHENNNNIQMMQKNVRIVENS
jgi:hypothetical protein